MGPKVPNELSILRGALQKWVKIARDSTIWEQDASVVLQPVLREILFAKQINVPPCQGRMERDHSGGTARRKCPDRQRVLTARKSTGSPFGRQQRPGKSMLDRFCPVIETLLAKGSTRKFIEKRCNTIHGSFSNQMRRTESRCPKQGSYGGFGTYVGLGRYMQHRSVWANFKNASRSLAFACASPETENSCQCSR